MTTCWEPRGCETQEVRLSPQLFNGVWRAFPWVDGLPDAPVRVTVEGQGEAGLPPRTVTVVPALIRRGGHCSPGGPQARVVIAADGSITQWAAAPTGGPGAAPASR